MKNAKNLNRRTILKGSLALGAATLTSGTALASLVKPSTATKLRSNFFCDAMHTGIGNRLDAIIEARHLDGEYTSSALMAAHCPLCKQLVAPNKSRLRATV